eukprot:887495-Prorocentrum_minimum.AAC.1
MSNARGCDVTSFYVDQSDEGRGSSCAGNAKDARSTPETRPLSSHRLVQFPTFSHCFSPWALLTVHTGLFAGLSSASCSTSLVLFNPTVQPLFRNLKLAPFQHVDRVWGCTPRDDKRVPPSRVGACLPKTEGARAAAQGRGAGLGCYGVLRGVTRCYEVRG